MGMIMSFADAITQICFTSPAKGKVHKAELLVMLDKGDGKTGPDMALVKLSNGKWTVLGSRHAPNGDWAVCGYGLDRFDKSVLSALVKVGAISAETRDEHERRVAEKNAIAERKFQIRRLEESCAALGIPVPQLKGGDA